MNNARPHAYVRHKELALTTKQTRLLAILWESQDMGRDLPTVAALSRRFRISGPGILAGLKALRDKGFVEMDGERSRTLKLTGKKP